MKLSFLLICLGGLLAATTLSWSELWRWDRRSFKQLYQDARAGKLRSTLYAKIVTLVSAALTVAGIYFALTWR
jgi:hypothetical protein